jgi:hypothetical protein
MPMDTLAFLLFCLGEHGRGRGPIAIRREEPAAARRARGAPGG